MRELLKIKTMKSVPMATVDFPQLNGIFRSLQKPVTDSQAFTEAIQRANQKLRKQARKAVDDPPFRYEADDRLVFERILGHSEVLNSHKWTQSSDA